MRWVVCCSEWRFATAGMFRSFTMGTAFCCTSSTMEGPSTGLCKMLTHCNIGDICYVTQIRVPLGLTCSTLYNCCAERGISFATHNSGCTTSRCRSLPSALHCMHLTNFVFRASQLHVFSVRDLRASGGGEPGDRPHVQPNTDPVSAAVETGDNADLLRCQLCSMATVVFSWHYDARHNLWRATAVHGNARRASQTSTGLLLMTVSRAHVPRACTEPEQHGVGRAGRVHPDPHPGRHAHPGVHCAAIQDLSEVMR